MKYFLGDEKPKSSSSNGDPHFKQIVSDKLSKKPQLICYDVTGKTGEKVNVINIMKPLNIKIFGLLKDDYYFHEIHFQYKPEFSSIFQTFYFNIYGLKINENIFYSWNHLFQLNQFSFASIIFSSQNKISCKIEFQNLKESFFIEKSETNLKREYLNVEIIGMKENYSNYGGIIGFIGNRQFQFFKNIQKFSDVYQIKIDDFIVKGKKTKRGKDKQLEDDCILLNFHDLIDQNLLNNFIQ